MFVAGMNLGIRDDDPDYPALTLGNYMLGGGLNSRLFRCMWQKEGISYGVGSHLNASSLDKAGPSWCLPSMRPKTSAICKQHSEVEVEGALRGFTPEELATAKSGYLQAQQVSRAQDL